MLRCQQKNHIGIERVVLCKPDQVAEGAMVREKIQSLLSKVPSYRAEEKFICAAVLRLD